MSKPAYTVETFKRDLENKYAWPGGYPTFFITSDGAALCHGCAKKEQERIIESIKEHDRDGWRVAACDVNWEDTNLHCDNCSEQIESAYGENPLKEIKQ